MKKSEKYCVPLVNIWFEILVQIFVLILEMYVKNIFKVKLPYYRQTNLK